MILDSQRAKTRGRRAGSASGLFFGFFLCTLAFTEENAPGRPKEKLPQSVAPQPVVFSHQVHAGKVGLQCNFCHVGAAKGDEATVPSLDFCLTCHRTIKANSPDVAKLRAASEKGKDIAWVPVYRVPDFVFFGHASHIKAGLHCAECHGPVETRDVLLDQHELLSRVPPAPRCANGVRGLPPTRPLTYGSYEERAPRRYHFCRSYVRRLAS